MTLSDEGNNSPAPAGHKRIRVSDEGRNKIETSYKSETEEQLISLLPSPSPSPAMSGPAEGFPRDVNDSVAVDGASDATETVITSPVGGVMRDFDSSVEAAIKSHNQLSSSLDRLTRELDKLLEDAPVTFISGVRKRVSSLNSVLKSTQRRLDNIDRMISLASSDAMDGEVFLCTTLCDCLIDLPTLGDENRSRKILAGLQSCCSRDEDIPGDTGWLDLRGRHIREVESILGRWPELMFRWYNYKRINIRVGCNKHGVGEGKLKKAVMQMLERGSIKFSSEDSVISIKRPGLEDEVFLDSSTGFPGTRTQKEPEQTFSIAHNQDVNKPLCTIACDQLFVMPRSWPEWDNSKDLEMISKVLKALENCTHEEDKGLGYYKKDKVIDLRGMHVKDVTKLLVDQFSRATCSGYLHLIVGCKKHGIGEGYLKKAVIGMLELDGSTKVKDEGCFVTVKLDGWKDLESIREDFLDTFMIDDKEIDLSEDSHHDVHY